MATLHVHDFIYMLEVHMILLTSEFNFLDVSAVEHEVLEREVGRLRSLYQQQTSLPQQQQVCFSHQRSSGKDFNQQFSNLSLKHKEPSPGRDSIPGQLHI